MAKGTTTRRVTKKQRAFGRSLSDFPDLNDAEKEIIVATREGRFTRFGNKIPDTEEERRTCMIRASLVRFLALGGDEVTPVHEQGVQIQGAFIEDALDLEGCTLASDVYLWTCAFAGAIILRGARTRTISLNGSHCAKIEMGRAKITGSLFLRDEFLARGVVRLIGAEISGNLECNGGRFEGQNEDGAVLDCDRILVGGHVFLHSGFVASGAVNFLSATIAGDLVCAGGRFGASAKSTAQEEVIAEPSSSAKPRWASFALILGRVVVKGTLWLAGPPDAQFHGGVDLTAARVGRVVDAVTEWTKRRAPDSSGEGGGVTPAFVRLDGLTYDRFGERTDLRSAARIAFLHLQRPSDLQREFKPQPWIQMVKVLRDTGHAEAAREVAIEYEHQKRQAGVIPGKAGWVLHWLYGLLVAYGHRPMRLFKITLVVWFLCGVVYDNAALYGWMAPTHPAYFQNERYKDCRPENGGNWTKCDKFAASEYTTFHSLAYSLDLILPLVGLQQEKDWAPIVDKGAANAATVSSHFNLGIFTRWVMWFEILFGWVASLLLAAVLSGLAKKVE